MGLPVRYTREGGLAVQLVNGTGAPSVKGSLVALAKATDNSKDNHFILQANEYDAIGSVYQAGVPAGGLCWVTVTGVSRVLLKNGTGCTTGQLAIAADTDGRFIGIENPGSGLPATDTHFKEVGHVLETKAAGTDVLARLIHHFN